MARKSRITTRSKIVLGALTAVMLGGTAFAVHADYGKRGGGHGEMLFERFDANKDGKITKDEIAAVTKKSVTEYDKNKDGKLSLDEFQGLFNEIMHQRMVRMFQRLDSDGDAQVTEGEIAKKTDRLMARMDRNDDGEIERGEGRPHHGMRGDGPGKGYERHDRDECGPRR